MKIPSILLAVRATPITPENKSTTITIATWVLMITFVIMFLSREAIKFVILRKFAVDDLLILFATVFAIGLSVTTLILASNGLGVFERITLRRANTIMKGYYASDFLYILSLCFAKLSLVTFFYSVVVQQAQRRLVQGFGIFILAWTSASLIAVAFQCGLPRPWEMMTLHCYNSGVFWIVFCIIDMSSDVAIIMHSVNLVAYLKVKFSTKVTVVACFAPRILVMGASLARLVYLFPITPHGNPGFHLWVPVICTQVQVCLSISTACIPYMKPFFEGAESGVRGMDDRRRRGMSITHQYEYGSPSSYLKVHKKGQELSSIDSTAATSLKYGRTPDVSPRIPTPAPLSPLTPPRLATPPNSRATSSRSPSERGLRIHIPPPDIRIRNATDITSPQTASSHALSPECLSPHTLLSPPSFSSIRKGPSPPPHSYSPRSPFSSSRNRSPDPNDINPTQSPISSASSRPPTARYSLLPRITPTPPPSIPPIQTPHSRSSNRSRNRISNHRMPPNTSQPRTPSTQSNFPPRTSSLPQYNQPRSQKKNSTTPTHYSVDPDPPTSASSLPKIPSSYMHTPPPSNPPNFPPPSPPSPQRTRNQRILTPQNSSRKDQMSPVSPVSPPTPLTFWRDATSVESAGANSVGTQRVQRPWEVGSMPVVRALGARSSPRIVVQRYE